ncbi:hypothetical protein [Alloalcanivorax gelatiniphagus]|uniref:Uncharacterized protein n=1 Tax=Alloalcanivorax gelatiniphagus TaxID=1194167 RepID=A0ABY2XSU7_9GAMM|nr:hypothetical protein [Alloalcanivorax gelatiniphagus]TMW15218.1 hypothetical protein FGS76_00160 [Alloalcanivorax gelatiniphagus]
MTLNPFNNKLQNCETRALELRSNLKAIRDEADWYESTDLNILTDIHDGLKNKLQLQSKYYTRIRSEIQRIEEAIGKKSESLTSLWNPKNWFDAKQRDLRGLIEAMKKNLESAKKNASITEVQLKDLEEQSRTKTEEIEKYKNFDFSAYIANRTTLESKLYRQEIELERIAQKKKKVDAALAPVVNQIRDTKKKKAEAASAKRQAQRLDGELSDAESPYQRARSHQKCEEIFGTGSPRKVIAKKESEIRRLDRDIEKLEKRAKNIAEKTARHIKKLILDGNNLSYQGDVFIGLSALKPLVPILASEYEVVLIFDASIRRALDSDDSDIRDILGGDIQVHIVATGIMADETIIDLADSDNTTFIVSNDRFAEFGEKAAIRDRRVIRHEIVAGRLLIHDLDISETFRE